MNSIVEKTSLHRPQTQRVWRRLGFLKPSLRCHRTLSRHRGRWACDDYWVPGFFGSSYHEQRFRNKPRINRPERDSLRIFRNAGSWHQSQILSDEVNRVATEFRFRLHRRREIAVVIVAAFGDASLLACRQHRAATLCSKAFDAAQIFA